MNCCICQAAIEPGSKDVYREVKGYVRDRRGGGVNHIRKAEPTGEYAHVACVEQNVPAVIPGQMSLV